MMFLDLFHGLYHFCINSGLGGSFYLVVDVFIENVFVLIFEVVITGSLSESVTMFTLLLFITSLTHHNL